MNDQVITLNIEDMEKKRYMLISDRDGSWNVFEVIPYTYVSHNFRGTIKQ